MAWHGMAWQSLHVHPSDAGFVCHEATNLNLYVAGFRGVDGVGLSYHVWQAAFLVSRWPPRPFDATDV